MIELKIGMSYHAWTHEKRAGTASVYYGPILLAAKGRLNAGLSYRDFADTVIRLSSDGRHWLEFEVRTGDGAVVTFYDFASVGKFDSYTTWVPLENVPARKTAEKGGIPIWCNTLLY